MIKITSDGSISNTRVLSSCKIQQGEKTEQHPCATHVDNGLVVVNGEQLGGVIGLLFEARIVFGRRLAWY